MLCRNGWADFAASEDYDTLAFLSPNLIKGFSTEEYTRICEINLAVLLKELNLTHNQVIKMNIKISL